MTPSRSRVTPSFVVKLPAAALRVVIAGTRLALSLVVIALPQPASAVPSIQLGKSASGEVLVGESVDYSFTASNPISNPDAVTEYNVSFRDVLPVGVTYDAG